MTEDDPPRPVFTEEEVATVVQLKGADCDCDNCEWKSRAEFDSEFKWRQNINKVLHRMESLSSEGDWVLRLKPEINFGVGTTTTIYRNTGVLVQSFSNSVGGGYFQVTGTLTNAKELMRTGYFLNVFPLPSTLKIAPDIIEQSSGSDGSNSTVGTLGGQRRLGAPDVERTVELVTQMSRLHVGETQSDKLMALAVTSLMSTLSSSTLPAARAVFTAETAGAYLHVNNVPASTALHTANLLAAHPHVDYVFAMPTLKLHNDDAAWVTQSNVVNTKTLWDKGLNGLGEIVGVADSGLDVSSCYFRDTSINIQRPLPTGQTFQNLNHRKIVQYVAYADGQEGEKGGHGTHVCGSVAGYANGQAQNGMAQSAKIAFFDVGKPGQPGLQIPSLVSRLFPDAYSVGARIHSNSWGSNSASYDGLARTLDQYTWANQDFLVLVAAGNSGSGQMTVGTPATAKNCVSVGAAQSPDLGNHNELAYFSSRGPTADGRIKPDVVAPGYFILSAESNVAANTCSTTQMAGTSMATPVTSGISALVRQYFREGFYPSGTKTAANGFTPMGALLKAVLINSGRYLAGTEANRQGTSFPNMAQGWGEIDLDSTLFFAGTSAHNFFAVGNFGTACNACPKLGQGQKAEYQITVTSGSVPLKVTLAWFDAPGQANSYDVLINDLDLTVTSTGPSSYPNGGSGPDRKNNVEQIVVATPQAGVTYTVTVTGTDVNQGPQPYALVITGRFNHNGGDAGGGTGGDSGGVENDDTGDGDVTTCPKPEWQNDAFCDDVNNIAACEYDGGACCGDAVQKNYCDECLCKDPEAGGGTAPPEEDDTPPDEPPPPPSAQCVDSWKGDGYCDTQNNSDDCDFDDGDCCGANANYQYCENTPDVAAFCTCLGGEVTDDTPDTPPPDDAACPVPSWVGDGYCDDATNIEACNFDGGDCCDPAAKKACSVCACLEGVVGGDGGGSSGENCATLSWKGDGFCDDSNNTPGCAYDGGDCCGGNNNFCSVCACYEGSAAAAADGSDVGTKAVNTGDDEVVVAPDDNMLYTENCVWSSLGRPTCPASQVVRGLECDGGDSTDCTSFKLLCCELWHKENGQGVAGNAATSREFTGAQATAQGMLLTGMECMEDDPNCGTLQLHQSMFDSFSEGAHTKAHLEDESCVWSSWFGPGSPMDCAALDSSSNVYLPGEFECGGSSCGIVRLRCCPVQANNEFGVSILETSLTDDTGSGGDDVDPIMLAGIGAAALVVGGFVGFAVLRQKVKPSDSEQLV